MACVWHDAQLCLGPDPVQIPSVLQRRANIITPVNDHAGNIAQGRRIGQDPVIALKETAMGEIMALDRGKGSGEMVVAEAVLPRLIGQ